MDDPRPPFTRQVSNRVFPTGRRSDASVKAVNEPACPACGRQQRPLPRCSGRPSQPGRLVAPGTSDELGFLELEPRGATGADPRADEPACARYCAIESDSADTAGSSARNTVQRLIELAKGLHRLPEPGPRLGQETK